ncbi:MAG: hypothetical protein V1908_04540 [Candidatus Peregrinibacteria bacterium]
MTNRPEPTDGADPNEPNIDRRGFFEKLFPRISAGLWRAEQINVSVAKPLGATTRRKFLAALVGGAAAAYLGSKLPIGTAIADIFTLDKYDEAVLKEVDFLEQRYQCEIQFTGFGQLDLSEKKIALGYLRKALSKYPPEYINRLKLVIVSTKYTKIKAGAWTYPENGRNFLWICWNDLGDEVVKNDFQSYSNLEHLMLIHHELEHTADNMDGLATGKCNTDAQVCRGMNDREWVQLASDGKRTYVGDGYKKLSRTEALRSGFAEPYGAKDPDEDEATIAAYLIGMATEAFIGDTVRKNPTATRSKKITKVKEYMLRRSNGRMNEQYWKDLASGKVDEAYWDKAG